MSKKLYKETGGLVAKILTSYREHPSAIHLGADSLPDREGVIATIHLLRELLFPGYFGRQNLSAATIEYHVGNLIIELQARLYEQITHVLKYQAIRKNDFSLDAEKKAAETVQSFLQRIPDIRTILSTDIQASFAGDPAAGDKGEIIFSYPGVLAVSIHRLAHELYLLAVPIIPRIMTEYAHSVTGIDIHAGASIGKYFFIDHGTGIVIGETAVIGSHVKLYHGVTLGALSTKGGQDLRGKKRHPTLEDHVTVYSGASILGGETVIGQNVVVASNVFITKSVPADTRVSVKNPELQFRGQSPQEFKQELVDDWVI